MDEIKEEVETTDNFLEGWNDSTPEAEDADELPDEGGENEAGPSTEGSGDGIASIRDFAPPGELEMRNDILEFARCFPEAAADPAAIPAEVWGQVAQGRSLTVAYGQYALGQERDLRAAAQKRSGELERVQRNARRSTGSMASAGGGRLRRDPFLEGWGD